MSSYRPGFISELVHMSCQLDHQTALMNREFIKIHNSSASTKRTTPKLDLMAYTTKAYLIDVADKISSLDEERMNLIPERIFRSVSQASSIVDRVLRPIQDEVEFLDSDEMEVLE